VVNVLGLDIGGANTKATFLKTQNGAVKDIEVLLEYFPIWKDGKTQLPKFLEMLKTKLIGTEAVDGVGVTITAELSDAYKTKKEGINHVLDCVCHVFGVVPLFVLDVEANLLSVKEALEEPLRVASANWAATGWLVSKLVKDCVVVDVGSTSTSIIPIIAGKIGAEGKADLEKLQNGELVYSGSLRTNIATIVKKIPVKGKMTRVSSELFSQSGDVHLILGNITEKEYTGETCDGRGKTRNEAASRLARVVCADTDMIAEQEIMDIARFVYAKQVEQIVDGLKQTSDRIKIAKIAVVTGLGREFLARKAAEKAEFNKVIAMEELLNADTAVVSPSVGVALLVAEHLEGETVRWKPF
jgi:(4-(4-[2-(gamma-L-glutamylamino)ethyl]phenoxymethyl)furan-2-yl)methanamine synthase